jgi:hypothetical protein
VRHTAWLALLLPLLFACSGSNRAAPNDLPVPPGPDGGCSLELLGAIQREDTAAIDALRKRGAVSRCHATSSMLLQAIRSDDDGHVAALIRAGVPLESGDARCPSLWQFVLEQRNMRLTGNTAPGPSEDVVQRLLDGGLDANAALQADRPEPDARCLPAPTPWREADGMTPLMGAALIGDIETARLLVQAGARLDAQDSDGHTPADYGAQAVREEQRPPMVTLLSGLL